MTTATATELDPRYQQVLGYQNAIDKLRTSMRYPDCPPTKIMTAIGMNAIPFNNTPAHHYARHLLTETSNLPYQMGLYRQAQFLTPTGRRHWLGRAIAHGETICRRLRRELGHNE